MSRSVELFFSGSMASLSPAQRSSLLERVFLCDAATQAAVADIVADVAARGDAAVREITARTDAIELEEIEVPRRAVRRALETQSPELIAALEWARQSIIRFHEMQRPRAREVEIRRGVRLGWRPEPLERVAAYAPGGRAVYPSSVLMSVVPAKVAGVSEIAVCSPPGPNGVASPAVLAACEVAGADRVFSIGGATAVAAVAHGTESVPRVDKVVGPGNVFVTEAKRQLAGTISSDCLAGPSELLVIADDHADAELMAIELMAQAEHDPDAVVVAAVVGAAAMQRLIDALDELIDRQPRGAIVRQALAAHGAVLQVDNLTEALEFATRFAPEHLLLLVEKPNAALQRVRAAGAVFLGPHSSVVFGDYASGTNHVLPTGGRARSQSGLSTDAFVRWSSYQQVDEAGAAGLVAITATLAEAEGLGGHAIAARARADATTDCAAPVRPDTPLRPRPEYDEIEAYDPGRRPCELDLSDNTNLFGTPPAAVEALGLLESTALGRYPSVYADPLKEEFARYLGVPVHCVTTGCGSDDLIDSTIRAFCAPDSVLAFPEPTFSMVARFARMNGVVPRAVSLGPDFELQPDTLLATGARAMYMCRPNNPTGNSFDRRSVERLADEFPGLIIVDEAYAEFDDDPLAAWASRSDNVVVLRTLSKAFGLAGLRVGFAVGPTAAITAIEKSRGPYKVGLLAETAAGAALRHDQEWVVDTIDEVRRNRERLAAELTQLDVHSWPSAANFLLVAAPWGDAVGVARALGASGIGVRPFAALPQAGDCVRVTVGPWPLMERFLAACKELIGNARFAV